jgi:LPXTG-motif cell wall-anchored protein
VDESITNVEMCLPSGTTRWTFLKCEPSCGYITFEKGELICHGSVLPSSEVHSLPDTGTTSVPAIGGAGALLALGLVLARIARRTSRPVRSSR